MEEERVHDVALTSRETIPAVFIRSENEQPGITTVQGATLEIPTIDFSNTNVEKLIGEAAKASWDWGMFQVVNHGIPNDVISRLQGVGKEFFELPREEKEVYAKEPEYKSLEGCGTKLQKRNKWRENKAGLIICFTKYGLLPLLITTSGQKTLLTGILTKSMPDKLFKSLSLGLGLKNDELKEAAGGDELALLKINYYPPCPCHPHPDLTLGVAPHTDMCALTILVPNRVNGLRPSKMAIRMMSSTFLMPSSSILVAKL